MLSVQRKFYLICNNTTIHPGSGYHLKLANGLFFFVKFLQQATGIQHINRMPIDYNILVTYGGIARNLVKGSIIFHEGDSPFFYYQIISGEVKLFSVNNQGKELLHGIFKTGQSFGESPILLDRVYPYSAQATASSSVVKIGKQSFQRVLNDYPDILSGLLYTLAQRIYDRAVSTQIWVQQTPENKIIHFLKKSKLECPPNKIQVVPYTRQQIANFTGLRVETVIRALIRMKEQGIVKIVNHKLYY